MYDLQINLMHIFVVGPLLFGIGYKQINSYMNFYKYLTAILVILPFMIHFPKLKPSEWGTKSWNKIIHLILYLPFLGYVAYKKDNSPEIIFNLLKIIGISVISVHSYLFVNKLIIKIKNYTKSV